MIRVNLANKPRLVLKEWASAMKRPLWRINAKYPNILARYIAILTDEMKSEADKNGGLKSIDSLPGPKTFPVVGNLEHLKNRFLKIHITQLKDAKTYGPMYKDQIFKTRGIVVQDPQLSREIYKAEGKLPHRDFSIAFAEFTKERQKQGLPKSFLDLNGEEWVELRRKFNKKMLAPANIKVFYPLFSDVAVDAINYLKSLRDEDSIVNDVRDAVLGKWALESIGKFVYGYGTGLLGQKLTDENRRFYEGIKVVLTDSVLLSRSPWMKYLYRKKYKGFREGMKVWHGIGTKHIKNVMELVRSAEREGKELDESLANSLTCYLMFTKDMDIDECSIHAIEFYGAGYDTTSITTSWLLYWLGMNPEKQEILYNEIMDRIPEDGRITDAAAQRMPYLRACIKESARLTPLAFNLVRTFNEDRVLRGYIIPAQTQIFISNYNMGRDERVYPNANSFVPERWLRENKENTEIHPFASLPFGYGARSCIGRRVAEAEMQVFIAQLVKELKIKYIGEEQDGECHLGLTLPSNNFAFYDR